MARNKIPAHVSERLVNRTALRYSQLDAAQTANDQNAIKRNTDLLENTFWVLDSVGIGGEVIKEIRQEALAQADLKSDPLDKQPAGNGGKGGKTGSTGPTAPTGATGPADVPIS